MIILEMVGISLISASISAITTNLIMDKKNKPPKGPVIDSDMEIVLENNNYKPLEEWRDEIAFTEINECDIEDDERCSTNSYQNSSQT